MDQSTSETRKVPSYVSTFCFNVAMKKLIGLTAEAVAPKHSVKELLLKVWRQETILT